jgi:hypothetical protein
MTWLNLTKGTLKVEFTSIVHIVIVGIQFEEQEKTNDIIQELVSMKERERKRTRIKLIIELNWISLVLLPTCFLTLLVVVFT